MAPASRRTEDPRRSPSNSGSRSRPCTTICVPAVARTAAARSRVRAPALHRPARRTSRRFPAPGRESPSARRSARGSPSMAAPRAITSGPHLARFRAIWEAESPRWPSAAVVCDAYADYRDPWNAALTEAGAGPLPALVDDAIRAALADFWARTARPPVTADLHDSAWKRTNRADDQASLWHHRARLGRPRTGPAGQAGEVDGTSSRFSRLIGSSS